MSLPIMGQVYQPVDIDGVQVRVDAQLNEYYFFFNPVGLIPSLYYATNPLTQDQTNDQYNFWRTK